MSPHTVAAYRHDLEALAGFCAGRNVQRWSALNNFQVRAFAAAEHAGGIAPRSIQRRLSAVRSFYEYLMREGHAKNNPALEVRAPKSKKRLPATLDADQMARLLDFRADDSLSARDKAMMELFYSSGLRLSELVGLEVAAVDLKDRTVRVLGKGSKTRIVPIGRHAIEALKRWLAERAALMREQAGVRGRARRGRGVRGEIGAASVGARGAVAGGAVGAPQGFVDARAPAYVSPFLCDSPVGIQRRPARCAGIAGARRHQHHPGLHAFGFSAPGQRLRCRPSASQAPTLTRRRPRTA